MKVLILDRHTGERYVRNSDDTENMEEIHGQQYLRTNWFMLMSRFGAILASGILFLCAGPNDKASLTN
jgi:hypothetical protein